MNTIRIKELVTFRYAAQLEIMEINERSIYKIWAGETIPCYILPPNLDNKINPVIPRVLIFVYTLSPRVRGRLLIITTLFIQLALELLM